MRGVILPSAAAYLLPLLMLFSLFLLLRGHHAPGGGFSGGLVAAAAFALLATGRGVAAARQALRLDPRTLIGLGLLIMLGTGLSPVLLTGEPFLTSLWWELDLPGAGALEVGTVLLFELGVYLAVMGTVLAIVFEFEEEPA